MWEEKSYALSSFIVALFMLCIEPQLSVNIAFPLSSYMYSYEYLRRSCSVLCKGTFHISGYGKIQKILRKPFSDVRNTMYYHNRCSAFVPSNFLLYFGPFSLLAPSFKCADYSLFFSSELIWNWSNSFMLVLNRLKMLLSALWIFLVSL